MIKFSDLLFGPTRRGEQATPERRERKERRERAGAKAAAPVAESWESQVPVETITVRPEHRIATYIDPNGPGADRFRYLRMRLRELQSVARVQTVLVTSALPQDGKTTISLNLATVLARSGQHRTVLVEADLHRPGVASLLGLQRTRGLAECIEQNEDPHSLVRRIEPLGWYLLQAGTPDANPTELMQSEAVPPILNSLASRFDWVVVDSPPVAPLTDAVSLSRIVDATLVVVRAGVTPRSLVNEIVEKLGSERMMGFVFNGPEKLGRRQSAYEGYYYSK